MRTRLDKRGLEHVGEQTEHRIQWLEFGIRATDKFTVLDTREKLSQDGEIKDERRCKQRVLAFIEDVDGRATTAHDLRVIFINRTLRVPNSRHVFDHDDMVWVLAFDVFGILTRGPWSPKISMKRNRWEKRTIPCSASTSALVLYNK